jgi:hypothetical protein
MGPRIRGKGCSGGRGCPKVRIRSAARSRGPGASWDVVAYSTVMHWGQGCSRGTGPASQVRGSRRAAWGTGCSIRGGGGGGGGYGGNTGGGRDCSIREGGAGRGAARVGKGCSAEGRRGGAERGSECRRRKGAEVQDTVGLGHRLNIEVDLQSLFGLHVT